jgi:hypothetical protein
VRELPTGWISAELAQVCTSITDGDHQPPPQVQDGIPFLVIGNIRDHQLDFTDCRHVPAAYYESLNGIRRPQKGDVLFSLVGSYGISVLVRDDTPFCVQRHIGILRPAPEISSTFLALALASRSVFSQATEVATGTAQLTVPLSGLRRIRIPIPPWAEQERIVAAIEAAFSRIEAGMAGLETAQRRLDRMRNAIRFAATRGELVAQDPGDEPAASVIARVRPTGRFRGTKDLPPGLGPLPSGWTWALMGALAQRVTVGHVGTMKDEYVADGIPFLRSQNVREDRFDYSGLRYISSEFHARLRKSRLLPGDVVIVRSGNVGTACVVPDSLSEANCADLVILQRPEAVDPYYAALYMNSLARSRVRAGRVGVALTHFNTQSVAELPVPVPPLDEQKRIVAEAQRLMSKVDALEAQLSGCLKKAKGLRSSILAAAFSGRLTQQDPEDEPGTVLLERIESGHATTNGRPAVARIRKTRNRQQKVTA